MEEGRGVGGGHAGLAPGCQENSLNGPISLNATELGSSVRLRARIIPPNLEYELYKISQALLKFRFFRVKRLIKSLFRVFLVKFEVLGCFSI